ncbi:PTS sugar transporter subunit IIA [Oenococcus sp. UCMA 17063]|nr:PTS sugar transporter subunit IIA [Oenococcus sp. UCMA 17063]
MKLKNFLPEQAIKLDVEVDSWESSIYEAGNLLVKTKKATPSYIGAMIESVKTIGPYIVVAPGIAMPHANSASGVLATGFSLITLHRPVNFGNKKNDPVSIVICLCAKDNQKHIAALAELAKLFGTDEIVEKVKNAKTSNDILRLLN